MQKNKLMFLTNNSLLQCKGLHKDIGEWLDLEQQMSGVAEHFFQYHVRKHKHLWSDVDVYNILCNSRSVLKEGSLTYCKRASGQIKFDQKCVYYTTLVLWIIISIWKLTSHIQNQISHCVVHWGRAKQFVAKHLFSLLRPSCEWLWGQGKVLMCIKCIN